MKDWKIVAIKYAERIAKEFLENYDRGDYYDEIRENAHKNVNIVSRQNGVTPETSYISNLLNEVVHNVASELGNEDEISNELQKFYAKGGNRENN